MEKTEIDEIPNFNIEKLPYIKIKSLRIQNLKSYHDCQFDFLDNQFICFIGPNGTGKSTALEVIQLLFSRFDGKELEKLNAYLGKLIRSTEQIDLFAEQINSMQRDFLITAEIECEYGNYEIQLNKSGFIKDHPENIKPLLYRLCYLSTLDKELHKFQLRKEKWDIFEELFQKITGYEIYQDDSPFTNISNDSLINDELSKYVLGFWVKKPHETVFYRNCSDGERKVIKSLSTLLNMEYTPRIILIDNIEMHVESKRHLPLVQSLKKCFPESQIFSTTHSVKIAKNFKLQKEVYDLRLIYANEFVKKEPWRIYCIDEIDDLISKAECLYNQSRSNELIKNGIYIKEKMLKNIDNISLIDDIKKYTKDVNEEFANDMLGINFDPKITSVS